jgi:hypothetical protein
VTSIENIIENEFRRCLLVHIGQNAGYRVWIQDVKIALRDKKGKVIRMFDTGVPEGAADISGIVIPEGWRIELELKGPKTPVRPAQLRWEKLMGEMGAVYVRYRVDPKRSLEENLDRAAYELDVAIEVKRRGTIVSAGCKCSSCEVKQ